jgi:serine/threonine-protein kinase
MGSVWLFEDRRVGREVALKRMHDGALADAEQSARFMREARVQGQLEHPSIVPVYDVGTTPAGEPFFTMRRVAGETLADVIDRLRQGDETTRARWSQRRLLTAFVSACLAVHYAHTKGILHRDLKPSNIMLGAFGEVYVLDWGLARRVEKKGSSLRPSAPRPRIDAGPDGRALTQDGTVLGTPPYMAPEQILGDADLDARIDVYALGLILHELYSLRPLHAGRTFHQIALLAVAGIDARPSLVAPDTPPEIDALCVHATQVERDDRTPSALALAESVERFLDGVRDTERRREMAAQGAARAAETLARAELEADEQAREQGKSAAMREVIGALALDAEEPRARELMVALLTDVPRTPPPAVQRELEDAHHAARQRGLRLASWVWASWALTIPAVYLLGIRSMTAFLAECAVVLAGTVLCFDMARRPRVSRGQAIAMAVVTASVLAGLTMWLGPFILVPSATSAVLMLLCSQSRAAERRPLIAIASLVVVVPFALEWTGLVPPSYVFEPDRLCFVARAVDVRPGPTVAMLLWSTLGFVLVPSMMLTRLRDQLDAAQSRLAVQSWQLRQLGRGQHGGSIAPPASRRVAAD